MNEELKRIKELVNTLNQAGKAYYMESREIMSNYEYDALYDELVALEEKTGIILANSPTQKVGYEVLSELPKETHASPMLSLSKTKSREELASWLNDKEGLLSWKMDGLTIVLTYNEGKLVKAVTRGNGEVGEVITNNAKVFCNVPLSIPYKKELILRGEAVITYSDFEKINEKIEDVDAKYKNPRNLCSGSVRQLNNEITAERNVRFYAFTLVSATDYDFQNSHEKQMLFLKDNGFEIVEYKKVTASNVVDTVEYFAKNIENNDLPSDGLVLIYDDIAYGESLGRTAKAPRNAIAFKWADETATTTLKEIEWSASRTGLINPVAIFEPVELEGTTVSRASVHNVSIVESLKLGIGDTITVYKANMIIPQIATNLTQSGNLEIPKNCPVCNELTQIKDINGVKSLYCTNELCPAKHVKSFSHFVSRDAMNIDGLSEATLEKFIDNGFIKEFADIYHIDKYKEQITNMEGFGKRSYEKLIKAIDESRQTYLFKFIYSLGIENIGLSTSKLICREFNNDLDKIMNVSTDELVVIDGVGEVIANTFVGYFNNEKNVKLVKDLLNEVTFIKEDADDNANTLKDKVFVITGSLNGYANRNELKDLIEKLGGKVTGSVTKNTSYLINNDVASSSSKNKKAKELNVPIISEDDFNKLIKDSE